MSRLEQGVQVGLVNLRRCEEQRTRGSGGIAKKAVRIRLPRLSTPKNGPSSAGRLLCSASEPLSDLWTGPIALSVAFSVVESPLDALKKSAKAVGGTPNDAFMAAVTGGLALYHEAHGSNPDALRVNMPINVRPVMAIQMPETAGCPRGSLFL